ncbi:MAG TPA: hypothetical protein PLK90_07780 [Clostridiales bacterium]|nr:hypothetical protein [Clostridiales bacterium]
MKLLEKGKVRLTDSLKNKFLTFTLLSTSVLLFGSGKYAGEFISGGVDARSLSLGNIILTSFENPSAVYFNPAFLPETDFDGVILSHSERFEGIVQQEFAAYKTRYSGIDIGAALIWINIDGITLTKLENEQEIPGEDNRILPDGSVSDNEFAFFLSLGKKYNDKMNWGAGVKFLYKTFEEESAAGLGFDVSGLYKFNDKILAGLKLQDVTTSALFWTTGTNEFVSPSVLFSAEYNGRINYFLTDYKIIGGTKIRTENYKEYSLASIGFADVVLSAGLELKYNFIFLRGGYNSDDTWSAGSGLAYSGFLLDYAFKPDFEDLGNTHKLSLSYMWK